MSVPTTICLKITFQENILNDYNAFLHDREPETITRIYSKLVEVPYEGSELLSLDDFAKYAVDYEGILFLEVLSAEEWEEDE